jgi:hypothetical protein
MRHILITLAGLALLAGRPPLIAAQKVIRTPASITFSDRAGLDRIVSDGEGSYTDAVGGVNCVFFSSTGDANLDTTASRNPLRTMQFDLSQRISGSGPTNTFLSSGTLDIQALARMAVGETQLTGAVFSTSIGQLHFRAGDGGTDLTAVRLDAHTWVVSTDDSYALGAGDVAALVQTVKNKLVRVGTYHLPFEVTVTCPSCATP